MIRVAINGYGRIGRIAHRVLLEKYGEKADVVAINVGRSTDLQGWLNLLKFDSVYGKLPFKNLSAVEAKSESDEAPIGNFEIEGKKIAVFAQRDPEKLPWKHFGVDVVIESTGVFTKFEDLKKHQNAGAKAVVLSAPYKGDTPVPTYVLGVNIKNDEKNIEDIISNASCTTNCITPPSQVMLENFGIKKAMMTTIHGYTSDQRLHDGGHKDYRRARAAALNIIPTSTGATKAAALALPELKDKFNGLAIRVPTPVGSLSDITYLTEKKTSVEEINEAFKKASKDERYKGILSVTSEPLVSSDIIGESYSSIVDLSLTSVVDGDLVKIVAWYDNEFGYANRLVEQTLNLATSLK